MGYNYNYKVVKTEKRLEDGVVVGLVIGVVLDKVDDTTEELKKSTFLDWFAPSSEFTNWPNQTSAEIKAYVEGYLDEEIDGVARKTRMKNDVDTVVISYENDTTITEQDKDLNVTI